jgi:hypothetical protein
MFLLEKLVEGVGVFHKDRGIWRQYFLGKVSAILPVFSV